MSRRKFDFAEDDVIRVLLWCNRHCCFCGHAQGANIEVHHLVPHSDDIDDAIPLCFTCHADIGRHNPKHLKGRKYSVRELKTRRDQVYEQHTRHLVPPVPYALKQRIDRRDGPPIWRILPDVGFEITNPGDKYPVQARIVITLIQGSQIFRPNTAGHYDGRYLWNLNPGFGVTGHFGVPPEIMENRAEPLRARIDVTLVDIYKREHRLLPVGFIHNLEPEDDWYFEPAEEELVPR